GRDTAGDHPCIRDNSDIALQCIPILTEERAEIPAADFFFSFDHEMQIRRQLAMFLDRFLNSENVRKNLAFVVRRAACKDVVILQDGLERRRIPKLQWIRRLHIVMSVDQNCAASGLMFVARPDDRVPLRGNELRLQPDTRELFNEPICTLLQLFFVLVISRNAWETQKRIKLFEIIVAHGHKSKPGLPQASTNQPARTNCGRALRLPGATLASGALALQRQYSRVCPFGTRNELAHEIYHRRESEHDSGHRKFPSRGVRENPKDRDDRQSGHNFHAWEIEGLAIRSDIALH